MRGNSSPILPIVSALFLVPKDFHEGAQNCRVYPNASHSGTAAPLSPLHRSSSTVNRTPLTLSTRFSSLPLHTFSPSFGGRRVD
jgi:hypothetical protein